MRLFTYLLPILLFLSACGGGEQQQQEPQTTEPETQPAQAQTEDVRTIDIIGVDQMKYVVKEEDELIGTAGTIKTSKGETHLLRKNIEAVVGE
jgi:hypothetical protein